MNDARILLESIVGSLPPLITPDWLDALRQAAESKMSNGSDGLSDLHWLVENAGVCAQWMRHNAVPGACFVGPFRENPFKAGQEVVIPAGAVVKVKGVEKVVGRSYRVKLDRAYEGFIYDHRKIAVRAPEIVWAGAGGYWMRLDLSRNPGVLVANQ